MRTLFTSGTAPSAMKLLGTIIASLAIMAHLHCNPVDRTDPPPEISNISSLSPVYVAYTSPDRMERPDTVSFSFDYTSSVKGPVEIWITIDSGTSWFSAGSAELDGSGTGSFIWIPKDADTSKISFFGKKEGRIKLLDQNTDAQAVSDTFTLFGKHPMLVTPLERTSFAEDDTILVAYGQNVDISGFFTVLFKSDGMSDWVTVTTGTEQVLRDLPLRYYQTKFVPGDFLDEVNEKEGDNFADPIRILVADYQQNQGARVFSDFITVTMQ